MYEIGRESSVGSLTSKSENEQLFNSKLRSYSCIQQGKDLYSSTEFFVGGISSSFTENDVRYLLKTKTSLQFKTNALILARDILATVALMTRATVDLMSKRKEYLFISRV